METLITFSLTVIAIAQGLGILGAGSYLLYFLFSLPLRRRERTRVLLDLLALAIARGQSPERMLVELAHSGDRMVDGRLRQVAAELEKGARLSEAMRRASIYYPSQLIGMLEAGEKMGNLGKVLPACRASLVPATGRLTSGMNYLVLVPLLLGPAGLLIAFWAIIIMPMFRVIAEDLIEGPLPPITELAMGQTTLFVILSGVIMITLLLACIGYVSGGWSLSRLMPEWKRVFDRIEYRLPWRRKRMERDFAGMLGLLLDADVPESPSIKMAADCTANAVFSKRAELATQQLADGRGLTAAISALDNHGEFQWRIENAAHGRGGFAKALEGWREALDAQAFQQEQAVSQVISTALVIGNGVLVGLIAIGMFQALTFTVETLSLW